MHEPLSLRKNFSWTFIGNVVKAASMWALIMLIVKAGDVEKAGKFILARSIVAPILTLIMLQLRAVEVTDSRDKYSFADYLGTRLVMTVLGVLVFIVISLGWYSGETAWVVLLWGLAVSIESVSDIIRGLFEKYEQMNLSGMSMLIKGIGTLVIAGLLIWFTKEITVTIIGIICVYLLVLFSYDLPKAYILLSYKSANKGQTYRLCPNFNFKVLLPLLWLAAPLGTVMFLGSFQNNIPQLVLASSHGEVALGYFGPIIYPISLGMLTLSAMGQAAMPRLARYYVEDLSSYCGLIKKLFLIALALGLVSVVGVILFGKLVLTLLYSADYTNYHTEFIILSIGGAAGFIAMFSGYGMTAARAFRIQLIIAAIDCSVAVMMAFLLVPSYGVRGAAITSMITYFTMLVCCISVLVWIIQKRRKELDASKAESSA